MRNLLFTFTLMLLTSFVFGQGLTVNDSLITIRGRVIDTNATVSFYNMVVVNKTAGKGIFGDYTGTFEIIVKKGDLIGVSVVGYQTTYISFAQSDYKPVYEVNIHLKMLSYTSEEVVVLPYKTLEELQEERSNIAKREVPKVTAANILQSPITALYIAFSKREKTKRMVSEMEYQDQQDNIVREILRLYVHNDIIDLNETDFEEFILFLNLSDDFLMYASDYELITYIQDKFEHFQRIKEGY